MSPQSLAPHIQRTYSLLLKLYPLRFRDEFEVEMQEVFADLLTQAEPRGQAASLFLLLGELLHTPHALWSAYGLDRYRPRLLAGFRKHLFSSVFDPAFRLPVRDGRDSWRAAGLELSPFMILGATLVLTTYLQPVLRGDSWPLAISLASSAAALLPVPMFLVGLWRGLPRWAYPYAGILLGYLFSVALMLDLLPFLAVSLLGALCLSLAAALTQACIRALPFCLQRLGRSFSLDWSRLSFGFYGLLPLAVSLVFDDGLINDSTPWLAGAALCMTAGALGFIRSRRSELQVGALLAGTTGTLGMAVLNRAFFENGLEGTVWILKLWLNLTVLIAAPFLLARLRRVWQPNRIL